MRNLRNIPFLVSGYLLMLVVAGCYTDDSTEDIKPVSLISVTDSATSKMIYIGQGDTLKLNPALSADVALSDDALEFEWLAYDNSTLSSYIQPNVYMSTDHQLKYVIDPKSFTLGQSYRVRFRVTDKKTGISSFLAYNITISNHYGEGWLLLEDKGGTGDLSMVFPDGSIERNVYSSRNTTPLVNPRKLEIAPFDVTDDISSTGKRMYILAQSGSQEYNYLTMVKKFDYSFLFFNAPQTPNPQRMVWESTITTVNKYASIGVVIDNGKVHSNLVGGFPGTKKWGDVMLNAAGNQNYNVAPYIAGGTSNYPAAVYDNEGKRFYRISTSVAAASLLEFPAVPGSAFDMNSVGMTMLFQDSSNVVYRYNAVMKDASGQPFLLQYKLNPSNSSDPFAVNKVLMNAPDITSMKAAAASTHSPHIYYSVGNKIYSYETTSNTTIIAQAFSGGEQVTCMEYKRYAVGNSGPQLVVATWDGTQSRLYIFPINQSGIVEPAGTVYSGFSKVIDFAYKRP